METVTATELARNTREILDKISTRGAPVAVERNHIIIAEICPPNPSMNATQALAGLQPMLTKKRATAWLKDSKGNFGQKIADPWK